MVAGGGTREYEAVKKIEMAIGEDLDDTFLGILEDSNSEGDIGTAGQAV